MADNETPDEPIPPLRNHREFQLLCLRCHHEPNHPPRTKARNHQREATLSARLLLPGAALVLLKVAEGMAFGLVSRPASASRGHGLLVAAIE